MISDFIGKRITLFCGVYIYEGILVDITSNCVKLNDAAIVYETGSFIEDKWKDRQPFPTGSWYVQIQAIESFGEMIKS